MIRHYLTVALRHAGRAPVASAISLLTLAIGFVAALTAYAFVGFWSSAERHFPAADRTYVLSTSFAFPSGFARSGVIQTPEHVAARLEADYPWIEEVARAIPIDRRTPIAAGSDTARASAVAVDPGFLEIFPLELVAGDPQRALREPGSLVVTADLAARLFGSADPLGQRVTVGNLVEATVTGVVAPVPEPSHMGRSTSAVLQFDVLASMDVGDRIRGIDADAIQRNWIGGNAVTYLLLPDGTPPQALEAQLAEFVARHVPPDTLGPGTLSFGLVPVTGILHASVDTELFSADLGVSTSAVMMLLGVLVLSVAAVNHGNLATARAARRVREIGVRKALGAQPSQVAAQHLLEAGAVSVLASILALGLVWLISPALEQLTGVPVLGVALSDGTFWLLAAVTVLAVTLLAGAYPAFVLARSNPADTRRGASIRIGRLSLFTGLVGAQFGFACFLLIALIVLSQQSGHLRRVALGEAAESLVLIENESDTTKVDPGTLRRELARLPQVEGVTETLGLPWQPLVLQGLVSASPDGADTPRRAVQQVVGSEFFDVMRIPVLAGRPLHEEHVADLPQRGSPDARAAQSVVVDRAFVQEFGFGSPQDAIGRLVYRPSSESGGRVWRPFQIVGVVENRHSNLRGAGAASTLYTLAESLEVTVVRLSPAALEAGLEAIDGVWRRLAPDVAISRYFFTELFDQAYRSFARIQGVFNALSVMVLVIACAGLLGIAGLIIERRRKEIGIRKVCGASVGRITGRLLASFSMPVATAALVVSPVAYFAAEAYLGVFIDRIPLTPVPFVAALGATLAIAWLAVIAQTVLAARSQPAHVLRQD